MKTKLAWKIYHSNEINRTNNYGKCYVLNEATTMINGDDSNLIPKIGLIISVLAYAGLFGWMAHIGLIIMAQ